MTTEKQIRRFAFMRSLLLGLLAWSVEALPAEPTPSGPKANVVSVADADEPAVALGSGVLLAGGRVLTGCRMLEDSERLEILQRGKRSEASLAYADRKRDLCELKVAHPERFRAAALEMRAPGAIAVGETVYAVGAWGGVPRVDKGHVVKVQKQGEDHVVLLSSQLTAGYTGGGLFDESGALVGILMHRDRSTHELSFAYPAQYVLVRKGSPPERESSPASQQRTTEAPPSAETSSSQVAQEYLNLLAEASRSALKYPEEARTQGWSGTTSIRFDIDPGGEVGPSYVDASSGYAGLDAAALVAVRKALDALAMPGAVKESGLRGTVSITFAKPQQAGAENRGEEQ